LRKAVVMPVTYQWYLEDPHAFDPVQRRISLDLPQAVH